MRTLALAVIAVVILTGCAIPTPQPLAVPTYSADADKAREPRSEAFDGACANKGVVGQGCDVQIGWSGRMPFAFEPNRGQTDDRVEFLARGQSYTLFLSAGDNVLVLRRPGADDTTAVAVRMRLRGGNPAARGIGGDERAARAHYLTRNDPTRWVRDVPTYGAVVYRDIYPGVAVEYHGRAGRLEYDLILDPDVDPGVLALEFAGVQRLEIDADGGLLLHTAAGTLRHERPVAYQIVTGIRRAVDASYVQREHDTVGFAVAAYDRTRPLIIDPVVSFSTYLGGGATDGINDITVDASGSAYVTGSTASLDFPTAVGTLQPMAAANGDVFVAKLSPSGRALVYSTYIGGRATDAGVGIAVDSSGNAYVGGITRSRDFPTVNALQPVYGGNGDLFVAKLNPSGSALVYSTYLGGATVERGGAIAIDIAGAVYVTGGSNPDDVFVTKIDPAGSATAYSETVATGSQGAGRSIAVDDAQNAYVLARLPQNSEATATRVTKLDAAGIVRFSIPVPGATDIAIDDAGSMYVSGRDADGGFLRKLTPDGAAVVYTKRLGGTVNPLTVAVDGDRNVYVGGSVNASSTRRTDLLTDLAIQAFRGNTDGFVAMIDGTGFTVFATALGGTDAEEVNAIAVDPEGNVYVAGSTRSDDFPTVRALQPTRSGDVDGFVSRIAAFSTRALSLEREIRALGDFWGTDDQDFMVEPRQQGLVSLGDVNGNGSPDFAVMVRAAESRAIQVHVMDTLSGDPIRRVVFFTSEWNPIGMVAVPDVDGSSVPEIAMLAVKLDGTQMQVVVKDARSGETVRRVHVDQASNRRAIALASLPDTDGNGVPEVAVLAPYAASVEVLIYDLSGGALVRAVAFPSLDNTAPLGARALAVLAGAPGDAPRLAVLAETDLRARAEVRDAVTGALVTDVPFGDSLLPLTMAAVPDMNGNGAAELAMLGFAHDGTGILEVKVQIRDASTGNFVRTVTLPRSYVPQAIAVVADSSGDGVADLAVLGQNETAKQILVKEAATNTLVVRIADRRLVPRFLTALPDVDGNGRGEIAIMDVVRGSGAVQVRIVDALTGNLVNLIPIR